MSAGKIDPCIGPALDRAIGNAAQACLQAVWKASDPTVSRQEAHATVMEHLEVLYQVVHRAGVVADAHRLYRWLEEQEQELEHTYAEIDRLEAELSRVTGAVARCKPSAPPCPGQMSLLEVE